MNHPVRLSETLVLDARLTGQTVRRSIAGQIEFWANVGRAIEPLLQGTVAAALCRAGTARPLSACMESVDTEEGRQRLSKVLANRPYPHYEPALDAPGLLVRIDAHGKRTVGRFVNRQFRPAKPSKAR
jgi:hypothetical protein